jgi:hypothetical protein
MRTFRITVAGLAALIWSGTLAASGPTGAYAVLDRVVFEPNAQSPERVQLWGAFAFVDGGIQGGQGFTSPKRGFMYFTMPASATASQAQTIRKEWADLRSVAGSGQAVAFGNWGYIGRFDDQAMFYVTVRVSPTLARGVEIHVHPESTKTPEPVPYITDTGIVRLPATGSHAEVVRRLRDSLKR